MPRITLISVALFVFVNVSVIADNAAAEEKAEDVQEIDPIVTGQTVKDDYIDEWEALREKYLECGKCAIEPQPYPGD